jgi:hypothetical protein
MATKEYEQENLEAKEESSKRGTPMKHQFRAASAT